MHETVLDGFILRNGFKSRHAIQIKNGYGWLLGPENPENVISQDHKFTFMQQALYYLRRIR